MLKTYHTKTPAVCCSEQPTAPHNASCAVLKGQSAPKKSTDDYKPLVSTVLVVHADRPAAWTVCEEGAEFAFDRQPQHVSHSLPSSYSSPCPCPSSAGLAFPFSASFAFILWWVACAKRCCTFLRLESFTCAANKMSEVEGGGRLHTRVVAHVRPRSHTTLWLI